MMPAYTNTLSNNILLSNHTKMKNKIIPYPSEFQNPIKKNHGNGDKYQQNEQSPLSSP
jgi:hypothetical protein